MATVLLRMEETNYLSELGSKLKIGLHVKTLGDGDVVLVGWGIHVHLTVPGLTSSICVGVIYERVCEEYSSLVLVKCPYLYLPWSLRRGQ